MRTPTLPPIRDTPSDWRPGVFFDSPLLRDEDAFRLYEKNMWASSISWKKPSPEKNWDKLKQVVERENQLNFYMQEICE
jgi:hypothetical protein